MSVREELQEAQWEASKANLAPCPNCGRKFNPDRIVTHQRICQGTSKSGPQSQEDLVNAPSRRLQCSTDCIKFAQLSHTAYKHTLSVIHNASASEWGSFVVRLCAGATRMFLKCALARLESECELLWFNG